MATITRKTTTVPPDNSSDQRNRGDTEAPFQIVGRVSHLRERVDRHGKTFLQMRFEGDDDAGRPIKASVFAFGERAIGQAGVDHSTEIAGLCVKRNGQVLHVVAAYTAPHRPPGSPTPDMDRADNPTARQAPPSLPQRAPAISLSAVSADLAREETDTPT